MAPNLRVSPVQALPGKCLPLAPHSWKRRTAPTCYYCYALRRQKKQATCSRGIERVFKMPHSTQSKLTCHASPLSTEEQQAHFHPEGRTRLWCTFNLLLQGPDGLLERILIWYTAGVFYSPFRSLPADLVDLTQHTVVIIKERGKVYRSCHLAMHCRISWSAPDAAGRVYAVRYPEVGTPKFISVPSNVF